MASKEESDQNFQLNELTDMLDHDSGRDSGREEPTGDAAAAAGGAAPGPSSLQSKGERTATAFWRCCQENGLAGFCDALTFTGLRDELRRTG